MHVKNKWNDSANVDNKSLSNIPNAKTAAAMRDADDWVLVMRAKEIQNSYKSNITPTKEKITIK